MNSIVSFKEAARMGANYETSKTGTKIYYDKSE